MSVWQGGRPVPDGEAPGALDRGLLLGDGLFETVLVAAGEPRHLKAHLGRLSRSADALGIPFPTGLTETLADAVPALWHAEGKPRRAALRITVTRGVGRGLDAAPTARPGLWISLSPLPERAVAEPAPAVRAALVDAPRIDPGSPLAGHKTTSALAWVLARREARRLGADVALVRTLAGDVAEADAANLFVVLDGTVVTPPLSRGVLPGITRARVLATLRGGTSALAVEEAAIAPEDLERASEVFLTASLAGITPVGALGAVRWTTPGPVAQNLAALLEAPSV